MKNIFIFQNYEQFYLIKEIPSNVNKKTPCRKATHVVSLTISDSIFQKVKFFGKRFPKIQIFRKAESKITLENIYEVILVKFTEILLHVIKTAICCYNMIFHSLRGCIGLGFYETILAKKVLMTL
jgi:hypothetical protein